ncbi:MAG: DUF3109 family protein [Chitinophagales bacterium]
MILIDDKILSDDLVEEHFVCNLNACKGVCCVLGEGGAPLEDEELGIIDDIYEDVEPYLTEEGKAAIEAQGRYIHTETNEYSQFELPLVKEGGACAYLTFNELGIAICGIQKAYEAGDVDWVKPVSCHLYPIRVNHHEDFTAVNYSRWEICSPACQNGKQLKVKLYEFLKEPLIRKFGQEFYDRLAGIEAEWKG